MKNNLITGISSAFILTIVWFLFNIGYADLMFYLVDLPLFFGLYAALFLIGTPDTSHGLRYGVKGSLLKTMAFPFVLLAIYYSYGLLYGQPVFTKASMLLPYFIFFPVLALFHFQGDYRYISTSDLIIWFLFLLPVTLVDLPEKTNLPQTGVSFDSVYRIMILLITVYAFVVIRRLPGIGFHLDFSGKKFFVTVWVWAAFIGSVALVGYLFGFVRFPELSGGMNLTNWSGEYPEKVVRRFFSIFLHTALFEELFFRGLFQNMLAGKINQAGNQSRFWLISAALLIPGSFGTGLLMNGSEAWFLLLVSFLLFVSATVMGIFYSGNRHHYMAMAITGIVFGLVHFHAGSVIYVGIAMVAGWLYGYVYMRTRNVFYAALIHTLVNLSPLLLGFELIK